MRPVDEYKRAKRWRLGVTIAVPVTLWLIIVLLLPSWLLAIGSAIPCAAFGWIIWNEQSARVRWTTISRKTRAAELWAQRRPVSVLVAQEDLTLAEAEFCYRTLDREHQAFKEKYER